MFNINTYLKVTDSIESTRISTMKDSTIVENEVDFLRYRHLFEESVRAFFPNSDLRMSQEIDFSTNEINIYYDILPQIVN